MDTEAERHSGADRDSSAIGDDRFRQVFDSLDEGFCIIEFVDRPTGSLGDYVHVAANSGYERQTGIPDIVGKSVHDIAPSEAHEWVALYRGVLQSGQPIRFERAFADVGRRIGVYAARIEPESLRQVSVLFRDVTDRRRTARPCPFPAS